MISLEDTCSTILVRKSINILQWEYSALYLLNYLIVSEHSFYKNIMKSHLDKNKEVSL